MPSEPQNSPVELGKVQNDERQKSRRSTTRSRKRAAGRQGSPDRTTGPADEASPVIHQDLWTQYEAQVDAVKEAYPDAQVWRQEQGFWFLIESSLLPGLGRKAVFLIGLKLSGIPASTGWGFWDRTEWIGPRHTNFPDGSICAFERSDGTWNVGDPIVELIDLYTLWALRHLHLQHFRRWPGAQAVFEPYERVLELRADEHCGCGRSNALYGDCCRPADRASNLTKAAVRFLLRYHGGRREPPLEVQRFVVGHGELPDLGKMIGNTSVLSALGHVPYLIQWPKSR